MIFEDAHWSDPSSLEAFGRTIDRIANLRVLLVMTFRLEYAPPDRSAAGDGAHPWNSRRPAHLNPLTARIEAAHRRAH
jgi:hypothetical protein